MDVIIVSKTKMSNRACVGGVLGNGRFVRLLQSNGYNQYSDTEFEIGDVYTITFSERQNVVPPHVEDILVDTFEYKFTFQTIEKMVEYLTEKLKVKIWRGSTETIFDGKLNWTGGGSGYVSESEEIPDNSVGFWISDKDLIRNDFDGSIRYKYPPIRWRNIKFVGFQNPVSIIPAGTLVRVSLARWWAPDGDEKKCYLQLSGWYGLPEEEAEAYISEEDDLPF